MTMRRILQIVLTFGLVFSILPSVHLAPAAADSHCDTTVQDGDSIQSAVTSATAGDTICVEAGTYSESVTLNTADLTLEGAKAGVPAGPTKTPADRGTDESVVEGTITLRTSGATVDGFTIAPPSGHAIGMRNAGHEITNNVMVGNGTDSGRGIRAVSLDDAEITANNVQNFATGFLFDGGSTAQPSLIDSNYLGGLGHGVSMFASLAGGHTFSNNLFEDIGNGGLVVVEQINVVNNTFRNILTPPDSEHSGYGILVFVFEDQVTDVRIEGNEIVDNEIGIWNWDGGGTPAGNTARSNVISGNEIGVQNEFDEPFDARQNYWGAPTGTLLSDLGVGDSVEGPVDTSEWCLLEDCSVTVPPLPL